MDTISSKFIEINQAYKFLTNPQMTPNSIIIEESLQRRYDDLKFDINDLNTFGRYEEDWHEWNESIYNLYQK